jgi:hypothetical protein
MTIEDFRIRVVGLVSLRSDSPCGCEGSELICDQLFNEYSEFRDDDSLDS